MKRDGFEAAAWRRKLWLEMWELIEAEGGINGFDDHAEQIVMSACGAREKLWADCVRLQSGKRPKDNYRIEMYDVREARKRMLAGAKP